MTEMSEVAKVLGGLVDDNETGKLVAEVITRHLAYRIRAELVCCDIFEKIKKEAVKAENQGTPSGYGEQTAIGNAILRNEWHEICYWGEAAARLVEEEGKA